MAFHTIIPAGGAGTRLWPLSRAARPKFLLDLTGSGASLLEHTLARLEPLAATHTIVTGIEHGEAVAEQAPKAAIVLEPSPRGTMAAIALAAALIEMEDSEAIIGSFAADHAIGDVEAFRQAVRTGIRAAEAGYLATLGIEASEPSTAYGYIRRSHEEIAGVEGAWHVRAFVEKPDIATAAQYVASGEYAWNAGMFLAKASALRLWLERLRPDIAQPIATLAPRVKRDGWTEENTALWNCIPVGVIDRVLAEPLAEKGTVAVVPAAMGWSDIGDYDSLASTLEQAGKAAAGAKPRARQGHVLRVNAEDSLVIGGTKPLVLVGIEGAVVIETEEAVLITQRSHAQEVGQAVAQLDEAGLGHLR